MVLFNVYRRKKRKKNLRTSMCQKYKHIMAFANKIIDCFASIKIAIYSYSVYFSSKRTYTNAVCFSIFHLIIIFHYWSTMLS